MRILAPLFFIGAAIAAWYVYDNWKTEREAVFWATELKIRLEPLAGKKKTASLQADERSMFRLLFFINKAVNADRKFDDMLDRACEMLALTDPSKSLIKAAVVSNYDAAKKFRLYDDLQNLVSMENGDTPLIKSPGWEEQKAVVGQSISPLLAPDAAQNIANLQLMPEFVRDVRDPNPTVGTLDLARKFEQNRIISRESLERVELLKLGQPHK